MMTIGIVRQCKKCGCTDDHACPGGCYWVGPDLCSRCGPAGLPAPPGYWVYEIASRILRPAVEAYLAGGELSAEHVAVMRAYLRQWIMAPVWDTNPYAGPGEVIWLAEMRAAIDGLVDRATIEAWLDKALAGGMDPL